MVSRYVTSVVWIWAVALLSSTAGVSMHQVYCYCVGKTTVSLFEAEDACHMEDFGALVEDCCKKPESAKPKSCCEKPSPKEDGCTKKTTLVFKLKTEYEVTHPDFKKLDFGKFGASPLTYMPELPWRLPVQKIGFNRFERPPPPLSGRMICVRHGVFRC
ncbi:MAG: hypothetical protein JNN28_01660 [Saprospiraceae bacterium]|nr:hypothetical protein [Saprospiraceae bacterium]